MNQILELPPPDRLQSDSLIWTPDPHGKFLVKGAVGLAQERRRPSRMILEEQDWASLWKIAAEAIPVRVPPFHMVEADSNPQLLCVCCGQHPKTILHIFHDCTVARLL